MRKNLRIAGLGGQGVITMGLTIGNAASLYDGKKVIMTEAYGPEITGGFARADVIISEEEIDYPLIEYPDVLVLMHTEGWELNKHLVTDKTLVVYDKKLAKVDVDPNRKDDYIAVDAFDTAISLGNKVVANVVMMGAVRELTGIVSEEALKKALLKRIPKGTEELNTKALEEGFRIGQRLGGKK